MAPAFGQAPLVRPANDYTLPNEAALGREAAAVITSRVGLLDDRDAHTYVNALAQRLVDALPTELRHAGFDYRVVVLDDREIVSLAAPGGPVLISRSTIEVAPNAAGLAWIVAHEMSHVALRHGTAQATASGRYQLGDITGRVIGAAATDPLPDLMTRAAHFAVSSYFLAYDEEHEKAANRLAAALLTRAGYDPQAGHAMHAAVLENAVMHGSWWGVRHRAARDQGSGIGDPKATPDSGTRTPDPGSRIPDPGSADPALTAIQARLRAVAPPLPPGGHTRRPIGTAGYGVVGPSGESRTISAGDSLLLSVPANWDRLPTGNALIFAPQGGYLPLATGAAAVTHGVQVGVARSLLGTVHGDLHLLMGALGRKNRALTWTPAFQQIRIGGRLGLITTVSHVSPVTGDFETVSVSAVHLEDDSLLYVIGIAPQDEAGIYRSAFNRVLQSIQLID